MKRLYCLAMLLVAVSAYADNRNPIPPDEKKIYEVIFSNLDKTFKTESIDLGQKCNRHAVNCLLHGVMIGLAQDGRSDSGKLKTYAWSRARCTLKTRQSMMRYVKDNPMYHNRFYKELERSGSRKLWECIAAWGVAHGEIHWHQELRFSMSGNQKQVYQYSFAAMNTP